MDYFEICEILLTFKNQSLLRPNLHNVTPFLYPKTLGNGCA